MVEVLVEYDYTAQADDELTIKVGDVITNVQKDEGGWWEGELNGRRGMFPDNFVKEIKKEKQPKPREDVQTRKAAQGGGHVAELANKLGPIKMGPPQGGTGLIKRGDRDSVNKRKLMRAKVAYSYSPENDDELRLEVGEIIEIIKQEEEGWWEGNLNGKTGVFPSNFVELLEETENDGAEFHAIAGKKIKGVGLGNIFSEGPIKLRSTGGNAVRKPDAPKENNEVHKEKPKEKSREEHKDTKESSDRSSGPGKRGAPPPVPSEPPVVAHRERKAMSGVELEVSPRTASQLSCSDHNLSDIAEEPSSFSIAIDGADKTDKDGSSCDLASYPEIYTLNDQDNEVECDTEGSSGLSRDSFARKPIRRTNSHKLSLKDKDGNINIDKNVSDTDRAYDSATTEGNRYVSELTMAIAKEIPPNYSKIKQSHSLSIDMSGISYDSPEAGESPYELNSLSFAISPPPKIPFRKRKIYETKSSPSIIVSSSTPTRAGIKPALKKQLKSTQIDSSCAFAAVPEPESSAIIQSIGGTSSVRWQSTPVPTSEMSSVQQPIIRKLRRSLSEPHIYSQQRPLSRGVSFSTRDVYIGAASSEDGLLSLTQLESPAPTLAKPSISQGIIRVESITDSVQLAKGRLSRVSFSREYVDTTEDKVNKAVQTSLESSPGSETNAESICKKQEICFQVEHQKPLKSKIGLTSRIANAVSPKKKRGKKLEGKKEKSFEKHITPDSSSEECSLQQEMMEALENKFDEFDTSYMINLSCSDEEAAKDSGVEEEGDGQQGRSADPEEDFYASAMTVPGYGTCCSRGHTLSSKSNTSRTGSPEHRIAFSSTLAPKSQSDEDVELAHMLEASTKCHRETYLQNLYRKGRLPPAIVKIVQKYGFVTREDSSGPYDSLIQQQYELIQSRRDKVLFMTPFQTHMKTVQEQNESYIDQSEDVDSRLTEEKGLLLQKHQVKEIAADEQEIQEALLSPPDNFRDSFSVQDGHTKSGMLTGSSDSCIHGQPHTQADVCRLLSDSDGTNKNERQQDLDIEPLRHSSETDMLSNQIEPRKEGLFKRLVRSLSPERHEVYQHGTQQPDETQAGSDAEVEEFKKFVESLSPKYPGHKKIRTVGRMFSKRDLDEEVVASRCDSKSLIGPGKVSKKSYARSASTLPLSCNSHRSQVHRHLRMYQGHSLTHVTLPKSSVCEEKDVRAFDEDRPPMFSVLFDGSFQEPSNKRSVIVHRSPTELEGTSSREDTSVNYKSFLANRNSATDTYPALVERKDYGCIQTVATIHCDDGSERAVTVVETNGTGTNEKVKTVSASHTNSEDTKESTVESACCDRKQSSSGTHTLKSDFMLIEERKMLNRIKSMSAVPEASKSLRHEQMQKRVSESTGNLEASTQGMAIPPACKKSQRDVSQNSGHRPDRGSRRGMRGILASIKAFFRVQEDKSLQSDRKQHTQVVQSYEKQHTEVAQTNEKQHTEVAQSDEKQHTEVAQNDKKRHTEVAQSDEKQHAEVAQSDEKQHTEIVKSDEKQHTKVAQQDEKQHTVVEIGRVEQNSSGDNDELVQDSARTNAVSYDYETPKRHLYGNVRDRPITPWNAL